MRFFSTTNRLVEFEHSVRLNNCGITYLLSSFEIIISIVIIIFGKTGSQRGSSIPLVVWLYPYSFPSCSAWLWYWPHIIFWDHSGGHRGMVLVLILSVKESGKVDQCCVDFTRKAFGVFWMVSCISRLWLSIANSFLILWMN